MYACMCMYMCMCVFVRVEMFQIIDNVCTFVHVC